VWVATQPTAAHHRGGTVVVGDGPFDFPYLEPGTYEPQAQQVLSLAYDGLIAYRRTGGTTSGPLVGNLAVDVPEPSADGKTYVFTLRRGIRFSNGAALEPEDFRASLEDLLRRHGEELPKFFDAIVGARRCVRTPRACDLSSGIVTDGRERTITVRLTRPDPYLPNKLASPLAYVAPAEQPFRPHREPPGTGPYRIDNFDPERGVELTRNPYFKVWSQDARPDGIADRIMVRVSEDSRAQIAAVQRGDLDAVELADAFGTAVPPSEIRALSTREPDRLHTIATPSLFFLWMNVHEPPFDDARVRRAVNYAIDRQLVAELEGGARTWTTQPSAYAVLLMSSKRCGSGSPCMSEMPSPSATGCTVSRYSSTRRARIRLWAKCPPPKATMSWPGSRLSRGISCSTGPSVARAAFHSTSEPPWAKTILGSAFKVRAIGLSELDQAGAISS
jgi:peptide/nickel transport system substrate-binding protein